MAHVADHLSVSALEQQYRSCPDVTAARPVQTIWLLAKGHHIAEVAATVAYARRWVERLLARYNAEGLKALGDLRCRNGKSPSGKSPSVLKPDLLDKLKARLREPPPDGGPPDGGPPDGGPPDGGLWSSRKVAAWMAGELGLAAVLPQRGYPNGAGRRSRRSAGRGRSPARAIPPRPRPRSAKRLKMARAGRRRRKCEAPGQTGRGLGHG
jgi:hypothetical protein